MMTDDIRFWVDGARWYAAHERRVLGLMNEWFRWKYATDADFGAQQNEIWDRQRREQQQKGAAQVTLGHCHDCMMDVAVEYGIWADDEQAQIRCTRCDGTNARMH